MIFLTIYWPIIGGFDYFGGILCECWFFSTCIFLLFVSRESQIIDEYFGFMNSLFYKSFFYIFLTIFAFGSFYYTPCIIIGCVFSTIIVVNFGMWMAIDDGVEMAEMKAAHYTIKKGSDDFIRSA